MDLSKWAVISFKDDTGLGRQAADLVAVLGIGTRIVVPSEHIEGHAIDDRTELLLDPKYSDAQVKATLHGLEGIIFPERHSWHRNLLRIAKELGLLTVCIPNWEWFAGTHPNWKFCDLFVCQSRFALDVVQKFGWRNTAYIPVVLDLARFPPR